jgi:hypothetical protein
VQYQTQGQSCQALNHLYSSINHHPASPELKANTQAVRERALQTHPARRSSDSRTCSETACRRDLENLTNNSSPDGSLLRHGSLNLPSLTALLSTTQHVSYRPAAPSALRSGGLRHRCLSIIVVSIVRLRHVGIRSRLEGIPCRPTTTMCTKVSCTAQGQFHRVLAMITRTTISHRDVIKVEPCPRVPSAVSSRGRKGQSPNPPWLGARAHARARAENHPPKKVSSKCIPLQSQIWQLGLDQQISPYPFNLDPFESCWTCVFMGT